MVWMSGQGRLSAGSKTDSPAVAAHDAKRVGKPGSSGSLVGNFPCRALGTLTFHLGSIQMAAGSHEIA